jgi:predicted lipoprotein with Yx(FWY)xxD motif
MPAPSRTVLSLSVALAGVGVLLAGCGSGGSYGDSGSAAASPTAVAGAGAVSVSGRALVDSAGRTVYFSDQESAGAIQCTGPCLGFWFPVVITDATAPTVPGVPGLGVIKRTDNGQNQLTLDKKPLYTFRLDKGPGDSAGDNLGDDFGGAHFDWHAASVGGGATSAPPPTEGYGGY